MPRQSAESPGNSTIPAPVDRQLPELLQSAELIRKLLNLVPMPLMVINRDWRVVFANQAVLKLLSPSDPGHVSGLREGDTFHCVHAREKGEKPLPLCQVCGMAQAVAAALNGRDMVSDCRISCDLSGASHSLDLRVWAVPLVVGKETISFLALADITDQKRRAVLENVCFHDLLNTLTGVRGVLDVLSHSEVTELPDLCRTLGRMTEHSIEEINALRFLSQAEQTTLQVVWEDLTTREFLHGSLQALHNHSAASGKTLILDPETVDAAVRSDRRLLRRVVDNLLLNALEASHAGGTVQLGCHLTGNHVDIWVHNETCMPPEVQLQVFQRSFSTKGSGRGIGTYSIRLLTSYLQGAVAFTSTPGEGTTFHVTLPQEPVL
ncbi:PAS domain-containing sensor histidine kinase [Geomonas sp.]|uniref:PAS domain-containing sensor histidine kinase n=1 Tax=Geomonas sp. TaxID=2651584 RepID=UPI002B46796D|nr:PAS domain-containing sensor histidine kinase [Geomonas sp.]HJV34732.1 PAS domain-containing sensor histidine kinase [Geomonas sp.]